MTDYPKWQESIRAAQEAEAKQDEETSQKDKRREFAANSAKLTALGNFLNSIGLFTTEAITYREDNSVGFIFTAQERSYQFSVWRSGSGNRLHIAPILTKEEEELFDVTNVEWFGWCRLSAFENNELLEDQEFEQEDGRAYGTVTGYHTRHNTTETGLKVWIAERLDALDKGIAEAKGFASKKLNKEGNEALVELATPKSLEWHELLFRQVRVYVQDEVERILNERNGEI